MNEDARSLNFGDAFLSGNPSGTPRGEVGGQALVEGVLIRSRTGYAVALRRPDGDLDLWQVPYRGFTSGWVRKVPLLRGMAGLVDMMAIGVRALDFSIENAHHPDAGPRFMRSTKEALRSREFRGLLLSGALFGILVFCVIPWGVGWLCVRAGDWGEGTGIAYICAATFARATGLLLYLSAVRLRRDVQRLFQYHGAEHRAVSAFESGRDLSVGLAQRLPIWHPRCGSTFLGLWITLMVLADAAAWTMAAGQYWEVAAPMLLLVLLLLVLLSPLVASVSFELLKIAGRWHRQWWARILLAPGRLLQKMVVLPPDDRMTETAIAALLAAVSISSSQDRTIHQRASGMTEDESAPGYRRRSLGKPAPPRTEEPSP